MRREKYPGRVPSSHLPASLLNYSKSREQGDLGNVVPCNIERAQQRKAGMELSEVKPTGHQLRSGNPLEIWNHWMAGSRTVHQSDPPESGSPHGL